MSPTEFEGDFTTKIWIATAFVLAFAVGPSAGVLLIPKQDWWLHSQELHNNTNLNATWDELYPVNITRTSASNLCYSDFSSGSITDLDSARECPLRGLPQILAGLPQVLSILVAENGITELVANSTLTRGDYAKNIALGWKTSQLKGKMNTIAYSTSPLDIVSRDLQVRGNDLWQKHHAEFKAISKTGSYDYTLDLNSDENRYFAVSTGYWHQPVASVECAEVQQDNQTYTVSFSGIPFASSFAPLDVELNSTWLDGATPGLSILPQPSTLRVRVSTAFLYRTENLTTLCLAAANWVQADTWVSKPFGNIPQSSVSVEPSSILQSNFKRVSKTITISSDWLSLLHESSISETTSTGSADIQAACEKDNPTRCLPITLSLYIVDALSRLQYHFPAYDCYSGDPLGPSGLLPCRRLFTSEKPSSEIGVSYADFRNMIGITTDYYQWQYAYGFSSSNMAEAVALVVVCIHVFLVFIHFVEHLIRKRTHIDQAWDDFGGLVAVAMRARGVLQSDQSSASEDKSTDTWRLRIFLRREYRDSALNISVCRPGTRIASAAPGKAPCTGNVEKKESD